MIEGEIAYRHGDEIFHLKPGDCLTLEGQIPHGPEQLIQVPIRLISMVNYGNHHEE